SIVASLVVDRMKIEHRCTFYLFLAASYCILFIFIRKDKECAHATNANQTLHRLINTLPIERFILNSPSVEKRTYRIVFIVVSAIKEKELRNEIRRTWAAKGNSMLRMMDDVLIFFVMGRSSSIYEEFISNHDILQVDVDDTYRNMVYKIEAAFRWVKEHVVSEFVFKVDSDTVVHIDRLNEQLRLLDQRGSPHWMACFHVKNSHPIRDSCNNWYISTDDFPSDNLPEYCGGPGYVLKRSSFDRIVNRMGSFRVMEVEDAFFTGIVAKDHVDLFCVAEMVVPRYVDYTDCTMGTSSLSILNTHFQFNGGKSKKNLTAAFERLKNPLCHNFFTRMVYRYYVCK
ncbi:hypothetical protein PRIPAC_94813, partial [Pristionchus pacificus]